VVEDVLQYCEDFGCFVALVFFVVYGGYLFGVCQLCGVFGGFCYGL